MFDAVTIGELLIDFTEKGKSDDGNSLYQRNAGGATANVMANLRAFGHETAFIGKVGDDDCGRFLKSTLEKYKINTDSLILTDESFTTLAFVSVDDSGERSFSFARNPGADTLIRSDEIDKNVLKNTKILHVGSLSTTAEPSRTATFDAIRIAKESGAVITFDANYRASLWENRETAAEAMKKISNLSDMIKVTDEEAALISGLTDPYEAAKAIGTDGKIVVVTLGAKGAIVCLGGITKDVITKEIVPVDTTGAGDSFWSGFLHSFLKSGKKIEDVTLNDAAEFAKFGNKTAAVCIKKIGAMLTSEDVKFMA